MENTEQATLVFKDHAGEYYVLPQALLERGRVPAEHRCTIERLIAEHQDVQGHAIALPLLLALGITGLGIIAAGLSYGGISEDVPTLDYSGVGSGEPLPLPGGGHGRF